MNRRLNAAVKTILITTKTVSTVAARTLHGLQRQRSSWGKIVSVSLTGLSLSLLVSGKAEAVSFTFEKIVDTNTPIPGGTDNFYDFSSPSIDNRSVAFLGYGEESSGIYTSIDGKLNVVANTNTPIPGGIGNFWSFSSDGASLDNGNVAFMGFGMDFDEESGTPIQQGFYTSIDGKLNVVVDRKTPVPGGKGNFNSFSSFIDPPSLNEGNIAFLGSSKFSGGGIYTNIGGKLSVVADKNTPVPSTTGNFDPDNFYGPSLDNGGVAFFGGLESGDTTTPLFSGIYTSIDGRVSVVADENTPVPDGTGNFFADFLESSIDSGDVTFLGNGCGNTASCHLGIYTNTGGKLNVVADTNTPIPGGKGTFQGFYSFSLDDENVA